MKPDAPIPADQLAAILFDLDGTLIDTDDVAVAALARRLRPLARGRAPVLARRLTMAAETPGNALLTLLDLLHLDQPLFRARERLHRGAPHGAFHLIPGVETLLPALARRYAIALVTTRRRADIERFLAGTPALAGAVSTSCGAEDTRRLKPHPAPIRLAAERLGVPVERCLMVGDTTVDIRAARRAGAWSVGVLCGFGRRRELVRAGAHHILASTGELGRLLGAG